MTIHNHPHLSIPLRRYRQLRLKYAPSAGRVPGSLHLSSEEQQLLAAFRQLAPLPRLAVRRYLFWRDIRLIRLICARLFPEVAFGQLEDEPLDEVGERPASEERDEFPLFFG